MIILQTVTEIEFTVIMWVGFGLACYEVASLYNRG